MPQLLPLILNRVTPTSRTKKKKRGMCLHNSTHNIKVILEAGNPRLTNMASMRKGLKISLVNFPHDKFRGRPGDELVANDASEL